MLGNTFQRWREALRERDPGYDGARRALRAGIVIPIVALVSHLLADGTQAPAFAVFGSISLLIAVCRELSVCAQDRCGDELSHDNCESTTADSCGRYVWTLRVGAEPVRTGPGALHQANSAKPAELRSGWVSDDKDFDVGGVVDVRNVCHELVRHLIGQR